MSLLRAFRSAVRPVARQMLASPAFVAQRRAFPAAYRAFASQPGFLDRATVSERVLEVVRQFEKVGRASPARLKRQMRARTSAPSFRLPTTDY
jgi:hypothetical protein